MIEHQGELRAAVGAMLRQLAMGLSTYRLFPGDLEQPAFTAAVERITDAVREALVEGPVDVEVHGEDFLVDGGDGPDASSGLTGGASLFATDRGGADEKRGQLAYALFERHAEWLHVASVPNARELAAFYDALMEPPDELADEGGLAAALRRRGVTALAVRGAELDAPDQIGVTPEPELDPEQRDLWTRLQDPDGFAASLLVEGLGGGSAPDQADRIYRRFRTILAILPPHITNAPDVYLRFRQVLQHLPERIRRSFNALAVSRVELDALAQGYIGTTPDGDLARMLVDLGEDGPSPLDLAERLVAVAGRRDDVIDFTRALAAGGEDDGAITPATVPDAVPGRDATAGEASPHGAVTKTAADLLARGVALAADDDVEFVREMFPTTDADRRTLALTALRDYLTVEFEVERLGQVLEVCTAGIREAVRRGEEQRFERLLAVIDAAMDQHVEEQAELFAVHMRRVLDDDLVAALIDRARDEGFDAIAGYLTPFGSVAVDRMLDALAHESDRGMRGLLVTFIADLARSGGGASGHADVVGRRLKDERWYVVRNAVTILQRIGGQEALPFVVQASQHPEPRVRRESVRALAALAGVDAVPYLRRLALDSDASVAGTARETLVGISSSAAASAFASVIRTMDDRADQRRMLEQLADHPAEDAAELLDNLGSRKTRPRLPWTSRRVARRLARQRRSG